MLKGEEIVVDMLKHIGENLEREGLKDTPRRVIAMWTELFRGYNAEQMPKITTFQNGEDGIKYDEMVTDTGDFFSHCLSGDTEIETIDGAKKIKDLVDKEIYVYTYNEKNKEFDIEKAINIRKTRTNTEIWKLTTDKNVIYATPEHRFLTYNRGWVELQNLKSKDSLVILNKKLYGNYMFINYKKGEWKIEHNFIYEKINNLTLEKFERVHHINYNKLDNNIINLQKLTNKEHTSLHARAYTKALTNEERTLVGKRANWGFVNLKYTDTERYNKIKEKAKQSLLKTYNSEKGIEIRRKRSLSIKNSWVLRHKKMLNHKVIKVEKYNNQDVYCMETRQNHNFVANNIVVHNCEHHILPFYGKYYLAIVYHPKGKILGLSKVARVVDYYSARLQIQERLVHQIAEHLWQALSEDGVEPIGLAFMMEAEHLCKTMRGVKKKGKMRTTVLKGAFKTDINTKSEFLGWVNSTNGR